MLEEALVDFGGCVIVVSHDRYFLDRVCTDILAFEGDGSTFLQPGNWSYYAQKRAERQLAEKASAPQQPVKNNTQASSKPGAATAPKPTSRKLKWAEERELESMEQKIADAEQAVTDIEAIFTQPDFHQKYGKQLDELNKKLADAKAAVEALYARWEYLENVKNGSAL